MNNSTYNSLLSQTALVPNPGQILGIRNSSNTGTYDSDTSTIQFLAIRTARLLYGKTNADLRNQCDCPQCKFLARK